MSSILSDGPDGAVAAITRRACTGGCGAGTASAHFVRRGCARYACRACVVRSATSWGMNSSGLINMIDTFSFRVDASIVLC